MKKATLLFAAIIATSVQGCAYFDRKPVADARTIERRLETTSAEIEKIYASIRQTLEILMRHEAVIRELEEAIGKEKASSTGPGPDENADSEISRGIGLGLATSPFMEKHAPVPQPEKRIAPQGPKDAYDHALKRFQSGDYHEAITLFDNFAEDFPDHDLTDNALYWKGECFYTLRMYEESIGIFKKVVTEYATGNKAPDAFLKIGLARLSLDDRDAARKCLEKVVGEYPGTPAAAKALKTLEKIPI